MYCSVYGAGGQKVAPLTYTGTGRRTELNAGTAQPEVRAPAVCQMSSVQQLLYVRCAAAAVCQMSDAQQLSSAILQLTSYTSIAIV